MSEPLEVRVRSPGFTPSARELAPLFALLLEADEESLAKDVERALTRLGRLAATDAVERFSSSSPKLRSRLCAIVGRVAASEPEFVEWLFGRLDDPDPKTRRRAARELGKLNHPRSEDALLEAFRDDVSLPDARVLSMALGKVGGERALARLRAVHRDDPELARVTAEAMTKLERSRVRRSPGAIDGTRSPACPTKVLLHVRAGFEEILMDELGGSGSRVVGRGRVEVMLEGPLNGLFGSRTFVDFGFPLEPESIAGVDVVEAAARAIASEHAISVFDAFTNGPVRYRIEWAAGKRRGATWKVVTRVAGMKPLLVNDPVQALWHVVLTERNHASGGRLYAEVWPRGLVDPRFSYRRRALPASSHPTVAAALARVAGVVPTDIVWDPFVGAGGELAERARLGPYRALYGTDVDERALIAAHENLRAANVERYELFRGDARHVPLPERPTLILTNPPFGKRVLEASQVRPLLTAILERAGAVLAPGGRLVWLSPDARFTEATARRLGFRCALRREVDVGGARAELQSYVKSGQRRS